MAAAWALGDCESGGLSGRVGLGWSRADWNGESGGRWANRGVRGDNGSNVDISWGWHRRLGQGAWAVGDSESGGLGHGVSLGAVGKGSSLFLLARILGRWIDSTYLRAVGSKGANNIGGHGVGAVIREWVVAQAAGVLRSAVGHVGLGLDAAVVVLGVAVTRGSAGSSGRRRGHGGVGVRGSRSGLAVGWRTVSWSAVAFLSGSVCHEGSEWDGGGLHFDRVYRRASTGNE